MNAAHGFSATDLRLTASDLPARSPCDACGEREATTEREVAPATVRHLCDACVAALPPLPCECDDGGRVTVTYGHREPGGWITQQERERPCEECDGTGTRRCAHCREPAVLETTEREAVCAGHATTYGGGA